MQKQYVSFPPVGFSQTNHLENTGTVAIRNSTTLASGTATASTLTSSTSSSSLASISTTTSTSTSPPTSSYFHSARCPGPCASPTALATSSPTARRCMCRTTAGTTAARPPAKTGSARTARSGSKAPWRMCISGISTCVGSGTWLVEAKKFDFMSRHDCI